MCFMLTRKHYQTNKAVRTKISFFFPLFPRHLFASERFNTRGNWIVFLDYFEFSSTLYRHKRISKNRLLVFFFFFFSVFFFSSRLMETTPVLGFRLSLKQRYFALLCVAVAGIIFYRMSRKYPQARHISYMEGLRTNYSQFSLNGKPFRILGGSIHYFRVPRAYWEDRLLKLKACGLNTVTTYVPWNLHEPERGVFNFKDQLDLEMYLHLAAKLDLLVILRPGPYICSEWDLGGLPSWLLRDTNMKLRTTYSGFTQAVNSYFDELMKKVVPYQYSKGGPVIAVQVENEYGSYAKDTKYMAFVKKALLSRGITELLVTSDNKGGRVLGGVKGVLHTVNFKKFDPDDIKFLDENHMPKMVMEYWSGWYDVWGDLHHVYTAEDMVPVVTKILEVGMSINLYMFHGGTNFGFMSGSFPLQPPATASVITSYDYDAPLSEAGDYTSKYHLLRKLFGRYHNDSLPELPFVHEKVAYQPIVMQKHLSLWDSLQYTHKPVKSKTPVNMENLPLNNNNGQSYGYTLYEVNITSGGTLNSKNNIRDRALVFVEKEFIGVLDYKKLEVFILDGKGDRTLSLLIENCGRANYGTTLDEQCKGLVGDIELNSQILQDFIIYSLDMKPGFVNRMHAVPAKFRHFKAIQVMAREDVDDTDSSSEFRPLGVSVKAEVFPRVFPGQDDFRRPSSRHLHHTPWFKQRCGIHQWHKSWTLLVRWSSANTVCPRPLASNGTQ
ncbi:beta-galactosidase-1-like protein 2 isoform X2 [Thalassophryne amazonica]|uniref:beta-galactosidase-1-like protein 2 isoform X2 n=1 Tax=Thalassophryne amazonica TaxID=390379 RepID=UPI001470AFB3|nr:beta-galactosidase-1-like protein 2 isoform X2 [Thalassophryne amazonica]